MYIENNSHLDIQQENSKTYFPIPPNLSNENTKKNSILEPRYPDIIKDNKVYIIEGNFSSNSSNKIISEFNIATRWIVKGSSVQHGYWVAKTFYNKDDDFAKYTRQNFEKENGKSTIKDVLVQGNIAGRPYYNYIDHGIINMSYGFSNTGDNLYKLNEDSKYIEKAGWNLPHKDYLSHLIYDKGYNRNKYLKIKALGNDDNSNNKSKIFSSEILNDYQVMSPNLQMAARSETITVSAAITEEEFKKLYDNKVNSDALIYTDRNNVKYYHNIVKENDMDNNKAIARPLLLRSFNVATSNVIAFDNKSIYGTSFGAPRVTRLAYEIKKKYPFLTYQQIKQVILTTAKRKSGDDELLDDNVGWGIVDYEKAIKGPSDFNAGLIEEQKYFSDIRSKIYDKDGNRYFYVNTFSDMEYSFDNDITSGLKGKDDGEDKVYDINGKKYRSPKILKSEELFYKQNGAGLYKDGKGTLVLNGKQLYNTNTYINEGTLILKNDSYSKYIVNKDGIFKIENNIKLSNKIHNFGKTYFNSSATLNEYLASSNSITYIGENVLLRANEFKTQGSIRYKNDNNIESLLNSKIIIDKNKIASIDDLKGTVKIDNIYLEPKISENENEYIIEFGANTRALKDIENKDDLPSYSKNEKKFFGHYDKNDYKTVKAIYNLAASDSTLASDIKKQVFTDIYSSYFVDLLDGDNLKTTNSENNKYLLNDKNLGIYFNAYTRFNLLSSDKYSAFSKKNSIYTLGLNKRFNDVYKISLNSGILNQDYEFKENLGVFNNRAYFIGISNIIGKYFKLENDVNIKQNITDITRKIDDKIVKNKVYSRSYDILTSLSTDIMINNVKLSPKFGYWFNMLSVSKSKKENSEYGLQVLDNILITHKLLLSLNLGVNVNKDFSINSGIFAKFNIKTSSNKLKVNFLNTNIDFEGKRIDIFNLDYYLALKYKNFAVNMNIDINRNLGLGLSIVI